MLDDLWQAISAVHIRARPNIASDDQQLLNVALHRLGIQWHITTSQQNRLFDAYIGNAGNLTVVAVAANYSARASVSEFDALNEDKLKIMHAKLGRYNKDRAIHKFEDSLWKLSTADFDKTTTGNSRAIELDTWLKEICLQ